MIEAKEFYRSMREAGIQHAPWSESAYVQRACGTLIGICLVGTGALIFMALCARLLHALAGSA